MKSTDPDEMVAVRFLAIRKLMGASQSEFALSLEITRERLASYDSGRVPWDREIARRAVELITKRLSSADQLRRELELLVMGNQPVDEHGVPIVAGVGEARRAIVARLLKHTEESQQS
jgi:DNA-binding XRE family transcriptional regulator